MVAFKRCDFLLGNGCSIVILVPGRLPRAETYTVSVSDKDIRFRADYENIAEIAYPGGEVFERIVNNTQIGLIEYVENGDDFPMHITHVAYVEVRRAL